MQSEKKPTGGGNFLSFAIFVLVLSLVAAAVAILAGLGNRFEWWSVRTALQILRAAFFCSFLSLLGAIIVGFLAWRNKRIKILAISLIALLLSLLLTATAFVWWEAAKCVPPIHDITTDTSNPPSFTMLLEARSKASNSSAYGGAAIAEQQKKGYPDIKTLVLPVSTDKAFAKAMKVAKGMGLEIVANSPAEGRIEATDTTFWFGFKDDIVIIIAPEGAGSRIDIRSASRVGKGDVGTNAERVRKFLRWMQE